MQYAPSLDNYPNKYNKAAVTQDRDAIVERFLGLPISFLYGAEPDQAGVPLDDTCATATQGTTHKARTRHFFDVLRETFRPFDTQLYATGVPGVAHDAQGVFASPVGVQALFGTLGRLVLVDATDAGLYTNVTAQGYTITLRFAFDQPPVDGFQITFDVRGGQSVGAVRGAEVTSTRGEQVVLRGTMEDGAASDVKLSEVLAGRAGGLDDPPHFQTWVGEVEVDVTGGSADKANGFQIVTL